MKKQIALFLSAIIVIATVGCSANTNAPDIAATTLPVYEFTTILCQGTGLQVEQIVTENIACLHEYTLQVSQMRKIEGATVVILSGAGLEESMENALESAENKIDASQGIHFRKSCTHDHSEEHHHEHDPHIWLSPANAKQMAFNIYNELIRIYPQHQQVMLQNYAILEEELDALQAYGDESLSSLSCRELITFHDGFGYFAEAFDLNILQAIEEESGSEASAAELIQICQLVRDHTVPAVFVEKNSSCSAATIIAYETGAEIYTLDMAISGESYLKAMRYNIDQIKEALE